MQARQTACTVTPLAGVWIEITGQEKMDAVVKVTPLAGVWIEIQGMPRQTAGWPWSLPLRECGLKSSSGRTELYQAAVTPLAGVWIEMLHNHAVIDKSAIVTPLAGVWIEIDGEGRVLGGRGVTPLAGVWIEIPATHPMD